MTKTNEATNLWGELNLTIEDKTPVLILKEQAQRLGELTQYILKGYVTTETSEYEPRFKIVFKVIAPVLGGFSINILEVHHSFGMYPLKIHPNIAINGDYNDIICRDEEEYNSNLKKIFQSEDVRSIVASLYSQSRDAK